MFYGIDISQPARQAITYSLSRWYRDRGLHFDQAMADYVANHLLAGLGPRLDSAAHEAWCRTLRDMGTREIARIDERLADSDLSHEERIDLSAERRHWERLLSAGKPLIK